MIDKLADVTFDKIVLIARNIIQSVRPKVTSVFHIGSNKVLYVVVVVRLTMRPFQHIIRNWLTITKVGEAIQ